MVTIDISKKDESMELATRANELLVEITKGIGSLSYLWDEVLNGYYDNKRYEQIDAALMKAYPFDKSLDEVLFDCIAWAETAAEELDKIYGGADDV